MNFSLRNDDTNVSFGEDLTIMNSLCLNHPACFLPSKPNLWFKVQFNFHFLLLKRLDISHLCSIALNHLWDTQQPANSWCTFISSLSLWDRGLHLALSFMCAVCLWAETAAVCQTSTQPFELTASSIRRGFPQFTYKSSLLILLNLLTLSFTSFTPFPQVPTESPAREVCGLQPWPLWACFQV